MIILRVSVGLDECSGVLEALRGNLDVLRRKIGVQNIDYWCGGLEVSGAS